MRPQCLQFVSCFLVSSCLFGCGPHRLATTSPPPVGMAPQPTTATSSTTATRPTTATSPAEPGTSTTIIPATATDQIIGPKVRKAVMTFSTDGDPQKDWNTQVQDYVQCQGITYLRLVCCSASRPENSNSDQWGTGSVVSRDMDIVTSFNKGDLNGHGCDMRYGQVPVGQNNWKSRGRLDVTYEDGTVQEWNFPSARLTHSDLVNVFHLDQNYPRQLSRQPIFKRCPTATPQTPWP